MEKIIVPAEIAKKTKRVQKQMARETFSHKCFVFMCNVILLLFVCASILMSYCWYAKHRERAHCEVSPSNVSAVINEDASGQYEIRKKQAYIKNGKTYYDITIGDYTVTRSDRAIGKLGTDNVCDTKIYTATFTNEEKGFLDRFYPTEMTLVRYEIFGEEPFTEAELQKMKEQIAQYFTFAKYTFFRQQDAASYQISIKDAAKQIKRGGYIEKITAK